MASFSNVSLLTTFVQWMAEYNKVAKYLTDQIFTTSITDTSNSNIATAAAVSTLNTKVVSSFDTANSATNTAVGAFAFANTLNTGAVTGAFAKANTASNTAEGAFAFANTENVKLTSAFASSNQANLTAIASFGFANTVNAIAVGAYAAINTESTRLTSAFASSNQANLTAIAAFGKANTEGSRLTSAYGVANSASNTAIGAFAYANGLAGGSVTAAFDKANSATDTAVAAFAKANAEGSRLTSAYATVNTETSRLTSAFAAANSATNTGTGAFNKANSEATRLTSAYATINSETIRLTSAFAAANAAALPARLAAEATSVNDWNVAVENGWYRGANATNAPTNSGATDWYLCRVIAHTSTYCEQLAYRLLNSTDGDTQTYRRLLTNNTWGSWSQVLQTKTEIWANSAGERTRLTSAFAAANTVAQDLEAHINITYDHDAFAVQEAGNFTPELGGSTYDGAYTYSTQTGRYVKVGRLLHVYFDVAISAVSNTGSGGLLIKNLPYNADAGNTTEVSGGVTLVRTGLLPASWSGWLIRWFSADSNPPFEGRLILNYLNSTTGNTTSANTATVAAGSRISGSITYRTAS